jgi:hypothetical protein
MPAVLSGRIWDEFGTSVDEEFRVWMPASELRRRRLGRLEVSIIGVVTQRSVLDRRGVPVTMAREKQSIPSAT